MIVADPRITFRISKKIDTKIYPSGIIEMMGECSLTGKTVIRYLDNDTGNVYEFDEKIEHWVPITEGICKNYFNKFAAVCLPIYTNNLLEFKKEQNGNIP